MDVYEAIERRCSVRSYEDRAVEEDKLRRILEVARIAPSASNRQEWKFVVVRDEKLRAALTEAAEQPFLASAPIIIAIVATETTKVMSCGVPASPVDCAIATDHMTLAAVAEGLGTCWIGHFDQDACREILGVPESATIIELLPMGYPAVAAKPKLPKTRKPLTEVVAWDRFA